MLDYVTSRADGEPDRILRHFLRRGLIVGAIVGRILAKFFKWAGLSWLDRLLGGAFGVVRGLRHLRRHGHGAAGICALAATALRW